MKLTDANKKHIDSLSYFELLKKWRNAPIGDPWFQDDTGDYWAQRMAVLRSQAGGAEAHVAASKAIGWEK